MKTLSCSSVLLGSLGYSEKSSHFMFSLRYIRLEAGSEGGWGIERGPSRGWRYVTPESAMQLPGHLWVPVVERPGLSILRSRVNLKRGRESRFTVTACCIAHGLDKLRYETSSTLLRAPELVRSWVSTYLKAKVFLSSGWLAEVTPR